MAGRPDPDTADPRRAPVLAVELLFHQPPQVSRLMLEAKLKARRPRAALVSEVPPRAHGPILVTHLDRTVEGPGKRPVPAMSLLATTDARVSSEALQLSLSQTRDWPGAEAAAEGCTHQVLVGELAPTLSHRAERLELFLEVLAAAVDALAPVAIHWRPAFKLIDPAKVLEVTRSGDRDQALLLALNVRMFPLDDSGQALLMDSCGLSAFGLPDLQVRFHGFDPRRVAAHLYNVAAYVFERGEVVEEGQRLSGLGAREGWVARPGRSTAPPDRAVLDLDPGPLHAVK